MWPRCNDPFLPELEGYVAQRVPGYRAGKDYLCPDCQQPIVAGSGHVVAWPEGQVEERRHIHQHCWRLASRRGRIAW
jgi:hypothetical protein